MNSTEKNYSFPAWSNPMRSVVAVLVLGGVGFLTFLGYYAGSPVTLGVGYEPDQPVPYSHALHVGQLGMDCLMCHTTVQKTAFAAVPATETCMACHKLIWADSPRLLPVRESAATGDPVEWVKVHNLPDYVYFNHSAHVNAGVGCIECHGRVDQMEKVRQVQPLSMGWCLDCHRAPEAHLRPKDLVTAMDWKPSEDPLVLGARLREQHNINPRTDCSTCHR